MHGFMVDGCHRVVGNRKCQGELCYIPGVPSVQMMKCRKCGQVYTWEVWVDDGLDEYPKEGATCKLSGT